MISEFIKNQPCKWVKLEEIAEIFQGDGVTNVQTAQGGETPAVKVGDVNLKLPRIFREPIHWVKSSDFKSPRWILRGDILVSGFSRCGFCCFYDGNLPALAGGHVNVVRTTENPMWVFFCIESSLCQDQIKRMVRRGLFDHFYAKHLKNVKVPIPSREVQDYAVRFLSEYRELTCLFREKCNEYIKLSIKRYEYYLNSLMEEKC